MQILGEQIKLLVVMAQLYPLVGADRVCSNTNCYSNRTDLFKSTCDLQKNCTFTISFTDDPCFLTYKYLDLSWECVSESKFIFLQFLISSHFIMQI